MTLRSSQIRLLSHLVLHVVLIAGSLLMVIPLLWSLSTSLKSIQQIAVWPPEWIPNPVMWRYLPCPSLGVVGILHVTAEHGTIEGVHVHLNGKVEREPERLDRLVPLHDKGVVSAEVQGIVKAHVSAYGQGCFDGLSPRVVG